MIVTSLDHLKQYLGINKNLDDAILALQDLDWDALPLGKTEIDKDRIFINRFDYAPQPEETLPFESHFRYLDLHICLSGEERIGITDISRLKVTERKEAEDACLYSGNTDTYVRLIPKAVCITFFEDGHKPKIKSENADRIRKAVVKVRMD